jgi:hypothetical protein
MKNKYCIKCFTLSILFRLMIILCSCQNSHTHQIVVEKNLEVNIYCDSINLESEVSFLPIYFHLTNYSKNDVFISFNNENDTISKRSLILITPQNDTIPIWYYKINLGINLFEKESVTFFIGEIESNKFVRAYKESGYNQPFKEYFKNQFLLSRIIYIPDQSNFLNNRYSSYDSIFSIKGYINVSIDNLKFIDQHISNPYKFVTKKL